MDVGWNPKLQSYLKTMRQQPDAERQENPEIPSGHPWSADSTPGSIYFRFPGVRNINFEDCEQCLTQESLSGKDAPDSPQLSLSPQQDPLFFSLTMQGLNPVLSVLTRSLVACLIIFRIDNHFSPVPALEGSLPSLSPLPLFLPPSHPLFLLQV